MHARGVLRTTSILLVSFVVASLALPVPVSGAQTSSIRSLERVNVPYEGKQSSSPDHFPFPTGCAASYSPDIEHGGSCAYWGPSNRVMSEDGRYVVFTSSADNLVPNDTNETADVFIRDRLDKTTTRLNVGDGGSQVGSQEEFDEPDETLSQDVSISNDGDRVAFLSGAHELWPSELDGCRGGYSLFVANWNSTDPAAYLGTPHPDNGCPLDSVQDPTIAGDGSVVAFVDYYSTDGLLGVDERGFPIDSNDAADVFVTIPGTGIYERVSVASDGSQGTGIEADIRDPDPFASSQPRMSGDGRYVAFISRLQGLDDRVNSFERHAYIHDRETRTTEVVSIDSDGDPVPAVEVALSDDGRTVAFVSYERDFGIGDRNPGGDVFVRDLKTGKTVLASYDSSGRQFHLWRDEKSPYNDAHSPYLSGDGRYVTFVGPRNTAPTNPFALVDETVWIRDLTRGATTKGSPGRHGYIHGQSLNPSLTPDASLLAFESSVEFLEADTNGLTDVFVRRLQPLADLTGVVRDGDLVRDKHAAVLAGAKVELFRDGQTPYGARATDASGRYSFRNILPGTYLLRVTLEDARYMPSSGMTWAHLQPIFDVRHTHAATGPVWIETTVVVENVVRKDVGFSSAEDLAAVSPEVPDGNRDRLDDLAAVFTSMQRYVGWLIDEISPVMGNAKAPLPVEFHLFSGDADLDSPFGAFYRYSKNGVVKTEVHLAMKPSEYEYRDGIGGGDQGSFTEWHEFTHHLSYVNRIGTSPDNFCRAENHGGYSNASTCDSVLEGLAAFLPTVAHPQLNPGSPGGIGVYPVFKENLESNGLKAYTGRRYDDNPRFFSWEEDAFAALLWDLYDTNAEQHALSFIASNGRDASAVVTESVELPLSSIWEFLSANSIQEVGPLWAHAGEGIDPDLTFPSIDLDEDGTGDTALFDVPFLLHGFHPMGMGDFETADRRYDLRAAATLGIAGSAPNRAFGRTDSPHPTTSAYRSPRYMPPTRPSSSLEVRVHEADGSPVEDGFVVMKVAYPEGFTDVLRFALSGEGSEELVLSLPPSTDELPMDGGPTCDDSGTIDYDVRVSLFAIADGVKSDDIVTFSNCDYDVAIGAAPADMPAMAAAFELPKRRAALTARLRKRRSAVVVRGKLTPSDPGGRLTVILQKKSGRWRTIDRARAKLGPAVDRDGDRVTESAFRTKLQRAAGGRCRVILRWPGDPAHFPLRRTLTTRC